MNDGTDAARVDELLTAGDVEGAKALALSLPGTALDSAFRERLARVFYSRGESEVAERVLSPALDADVAQSAGAAAMALMGEILEDLGRPLQARRWYERAVAVDVTQIRARDRLEGLKRTANAGTTRAGATLLTDGALTRGRYRVRRELGRGGAGTVFLAEDLNTGRDVALKVYHAREARDMKRLRTEARTAAGFEHPGVVRIMDLDLGLGAIAMEPLVQGSLRGRLRAADYDTIRLRHWMLSLCDALGFVHRSGIVHCDLKPSNVLLRADQTVVLTDFGLAVGVGQTGRTAGEGTLRYMSEQQRRGEPASPAFDVYALGVALGELLEPLANHDDDTGYASLQVLSQRCCAPDPERRPTLGEIAAQFTDPREA